MLAVFAGATTVAARIDEPTLAAHQIVMSMFLFLALALDALAVPAQTIVAEELGRDDRRDGAPRSPRGPRDCRCSPARRCAVLLAVLAPLLPHLFTDDRRVISRAVAALWWLAVMLLPGAVAFAYDGVLIGAGDYRFLGRAASYLVAVLPIGAVTLLVPRARHRRHLGRSAVWMALRAVVNHLRTQRVLVREPAMVVESIRPDR